MNLAKARNPLKIFHLILKVNKRFFSIFRAIEYSLCRCAVAGGIMDEEEQANTSHASKWCSRGKKFLFVLAVSV
jgi:hypothetical protein